MPLINKVPFVSGAVFTPEAATEMTGIAFDDLPQYLGHFLRLPDDALSNAAGSIKDRVAKNELNLKVTAGTGLNANYTSGKVFYGLTPFAIVGGSVSLTPTEVNYIYVDTTGAVISTTTALPIFRALIAVVTTNTTGVTVVYDTREGYQVETIRPYSLSLRNFGGRGDNGAFVAAGGEVLSDGEYYFTTFTVGAGKTITIDKLARIYCTGNVVIQGVVNVTPAASGGGKIAVSGIRGVGGVGQGVGGGQGETPSQTYNHLVSPLGSGGGGGYAGTSSTLNSDIYLTTIGGSGGGCLWIESAGNINISSGSNINVGGTSGQNGSTGGTTSSTYYGMGGAGGGSGGLILLKSLGSCTVAGVLNANGGSGGASVIGNANTAAEAGSGGGGGRIVIFSPSINTTGSTLNLAGGAGGGAVPVAATAFGIGGVGASYGGQGGTQDGNGVAGNAGVLITRTFTPVG